MAKIWNFRVKRNRNARRELCFSKFSRFSNTSRAKQYSWKENWTLQVYVQPRYDVILMHEGAKASSLDHTSINLNKRHYRGSPTKFEIHIPQTLDTIQQDRSYDPLQRSVKRDADTVELITRDIISGSYLHSVVKGTKSPFQRYIINFQLTIVPSECSTI